MQCTEKEGFEKDMRSPRLHDWAETSARIEAPTHD